MGLVIFGGVILTSVSHVIMLVFLHLGFWVFFGVINLDFKEISCILSVKIFVVFRWDLDMVELSE